VNLVEASQVVKRFDGFTAVDRVSLVVPRGGLIGLAGTNGAGKSTLFACLAGQLLPDGGQILLQGNDVSSLAPHARAARGLARTFQVPRVFESMTVLENLVLAATSRADESFCAAFLRRRQLSSREARHRSAADEVLQRMSLTRVAASRAGELSGGQRKLLELGRALMLEPHCILLDEPFAGVNPVLIDEIGHHIVELNKTGIAFLIIEHHLQALQSLVSELYVMDQGRVLAHGPPREVLGDDRVSEAYMGGIV
jgi:branched-chain amino acid transport system ATP-binding protein